MHWDRWINRDDTCSLFMLCKQIHGTWQRTITVSLGFILWDDSLSTLPVAGHIQTLRCLNTNRATAVTWFMYPVLVVLCWLKVKEVGLSVEDCSCLAQDAYRIFGVYWSLGGVNSSLPPYWPARLSALSTSQNPLHLKFNGVPARVYLSVSSCWKGVL